jgi:hypothetical protein
MDAAFREIFREQLALYQVSQALLGGLPYPQELFDFELRGRSRCRRGD